MKSILLAVSLVLINSCGSNDSQQQSPVDNKVVEVPTTKDPEDIQTIALDSATDLPACSEKNETQLAYIIGKDQFYLCKAKKWDMVDIRGAKGDKGDTGKDGVYASDNKWTDAVSGKTWVLGAADVYVGTGALWTGASQACRGSFRLPIIAEGLDAVRHGILSVAGSMVSTPILSFWTSEASGGSQYYVFIDGQSLPDRALDVTSALHSIFCISN